MKDQHKLIKGYRDLSQEEIDLINQIKNKEAELARLWRAVNASEVFDKRHLDIAKTHLETGFMFFVKAVAKPESNF